MADGGNPIVNLIGQLFGLLGGSGPDWGPTISGNSTIGLSSLSGVGDFLQQTVDGVKSIVKNIWNDVILAVLKKILDAYSKLRDLLHKILDPVLKFLHRLRQIYDQYFNQFVKPLLNVIQRIRQFLKIFELLGFKWAKRLDADLGAIENKIIQIYTTIRQNLNLVTTWIQLIVDPTGLLRRNPLFGAIIRSAPELRNLMLQQVTTSLTPDQQAAQDAANGRYTKSAIADRQNNYYSQGIVPPDLDASRQQFLQRLNAYSGS